MEPHVRKSTTLFIRNLPLTTSNDKLEKLFSDIGPIKQCFVVKDKGSSNCKGYGYVKFSLIEDAESAKSEIKSLDGRKLFISYADRKRDRKKRDMREKTAGKADKSRDHEGVSEMGKKTENFVDSSDDAEEDNSENVLGDKTMDKEKISKERQEKKYLNSKTLLVSGWTEDIDLSKVQKTMEKFVVRNICKLEYPMKNREERTALVRFKSIRDTKRGMNKLNGKEVQGCRLTALQMSKDTQTVLDCIPQTILKKCRLIIRNLSFKCKEENLRAAFEKFGLVTEVKIPVKQDGKMRGFGFVQFTNVKDASKAITGMNTKFILERPVAVDWAIAKDKYVSSMQKESAEQKQEESDGDSGSDEGSFSAGSDVSDKPNETIKKKKAVTKESDTESEDEDEEKDDDETSDEGFDESEDDMKDAISDSEEEEDKIKKTKKKKGSKQLVNRKSDVDQGKTLFIRNISYDTSEESLMEKFAQFGKVNYCKIVMDPMTEHSRGTAFIQYRDKESAEKCIQRSNDSSKNGGIVIDHRRLNVTIAVDRNQAAELKKKEKEKKEKVDKRNLHLVREGMIRPGTQAAQALDKADLARRSKLEAVKRQKLKNPNIFVSATRLSVHNIPISVEEKQLKSIFLKAAGAKDAVINECRIMRDMARVNSEGVGKSRGYGFVNFAEHKHALQALHETNNKADFFREKRKLIVEFSLENKAALEAKEKRLERFKAKQEALKRKREEQAEESHMKTPEKRKKKTNKGVKLTDKYIGISTLPEGVDAKKIPKGLPSHLGPKIRHKPRPQAETKKKKKGQKSEYTQNNATLKKSPAGTGNVVIENRKRKLLHNLEKPSKKNKKGRGRQQSDDFDRLVHKYKQTLLSSSKKSKSKWFDA